MASKTLSDLSETMRKIDICMLSTHTAGNSIGSRPMSNNGEVDYDGDSYFFTWDESRMVADIRDDPNVSLNFQGKDWFSVAVEGMAEIVDDKAQFETHWTPDLDRWFKDGVETDGLVMIAVKASRVAYWDGEDNGEIIL